MSWQRVLRQRPHPAPWHRAREAPRRSMLGDNLYMTWWDENDRLPYLTVSRDHGLTWSAPLMIAPPGVQEVNFPTIDAGDPGRIVIHFPGTVVGDRGDSQRPWNLYEVVSTNALDADPLFVFAVANDPAQPVHRGNCGPGRCAGMFDFLDVEVPPAEAPAFAQGFWAAGVDTCDAACETYGGAAGRMDGIVVRQTGGPPLRTPPLRIEDTDPAIEYAGGWHRKDAAGASGGSYHRRVGGKNGGGGANPTARLVFEGSAITYFYATSSAGGTADVSIDGALARTVSFAGPTAEPAFGGSATFDGLDDGPHEIVVAHRSGIATLDAFEIAPARGTAGADESAPLTRSLTELRAGTLSGLPGGLTTRDVRDRRGDRGDLGRRLRQRQAAPRAAPRTRRRPPRLRRRVALGQRAVRSRRQASARRRLHRAGDRSARRREGGRDQRREDGARPVAPPRFAAHFPAARRPRRAAGCLCAPVDGTRVAIAAQLVGRGSGSFTR